MAIPGYRILRKIRQGGMSTVYLAVQQSVDREVAIKVMSPALNNDPSFGSRFYREAKIVGKLSHPNIVSIYDVGSHKHYNYIAMDYLPGKPLTERIKRGIPLEESLSIVKDIASALDYAHQQGFIHRDIKPDNILFRADGGAVLCDFGIAKSIKTDLNMTSIGSVLGTPHYMSPEQAQGKTINQCADLYSLGIVFYEMLTGQPPFTNEDPVAVAVKHLTAPIPKLPSEYRALQAVINTLLAKNPADRYQSGQQLMEALDNLQNKLEKRSNNHTTQTLATALQSAQLIKALFHSFSDRLKQRLRRHLIDKTQIEQAALQLDPSQMAQIDDFVLNDKETHIVHRIASKPIKRGNRRWLYWPASIAIDLLSAFIYLDEYQPEQLQNYYQNIITVNKTLEQETLTDLVSQLIPKEVADINTATEVSPTVINSERLQTIKRSNNPDFYLTLKKYPLTIQTEPKWATVKILNIKPSYHDEIRLEEGDYQIQVAAKDYHPETFWVSIKNQGLIQQVTLKPTRKLLASGTIINDELADKSPAPAMVVIPKGKLHINGKSPYQLRISKALAIGQHEVTFSDYDKYSKANNKPLIDDNGWGRGRRPVINISFDEAVNYANWLSEQTGEIYRLPNREEWEYALRARSISLYWWGNNKKPNVANCRRGCDSEWSQLFGSTTAPVASYPANDFGLYDMSGNVAEWLDECGETQTAEKHCDTRLTAGGSHSTSIKQLISGRYENSALTEKAKDIGFRLLLEL